MKLKNNVESLLDSLSKSKFRGSFHLNKKMKDYVQEKGLDKILKKCGEECSEVIIAAKNNDHNELVMEISDLLYHLTVLMVHQNVTVEDINAELEKRSLKSNNLKQFHSVDKNS